MKGIFFTIVVIVILFFIGYRWLSHMPKQTPPKTYPSVDLKKYVGTWYEIARLPNRFEKGCRCVSATYQLRKDYIEVINRCIKNKKLKTVKGKAWPVQGSHNSKLKVQFFWPFKGNYWIIYVDKNYQYALVGSPSRKYLWILARNKEMPSSDFFALKQIAEQEKFNTTHLIYTHQLSCNTLN